MLEIEALIKHTSGIKLLYVEDNLDARESTLSILEEFFNDISVATNGEEGLEIFKNSNIDLIITDINMPKINGLDMIAKIREIDKDISILVISAYHESGFFIESIKLGVEGYLLKPVDLEQFMIMIDKAIQKLIIRDELAANTNLLHQYQEVTDRSSIVSKADKDGNITYVNDRFCEISGYTREELIGNNHRKVRHPDMPDSTFKNLWETISKKKEIWSGIIRNRGKDGSSYYVNATVKPILDSKGDIIEYISLRDDITDIMNPRKQLQDLVNSCDESVLVLLQIENFEDIEKFYGRTLSQKIEQEFSDIIMSLVPKACGFDKVYLLNDGKYAFAKDKKSCSLEIEDIVKLLEEFQELINDSKIEIGELDYDMSIIMSLAIGSDTLSNANYGLKELLNTNQDFILASDMVKEEYKEAENNLKTLKMIKEAIDSSNIISYFQPIVNNKTQEIEKYESLVRLVDADAKVLSPYFFLDVAKKAKYYSQITAIVLENSFNALKLTNKNISINISILDIEKRSTRKKIFRLLKENKENLHRVVFELLEDENVKNFDVIKSFIKYVKSMGVKIAIDDFGAGYSNFERLLDYQPAILKIDGSLIKNIVTDKFSLDVVETIVSFAKKQKIQTIAEYVENEEIFNKLKEIGVDYSQGYYFSKPEPLV